MNLPNYITLLRVFLTPLFISLLLYQYFGLALLVFVITALSDGLDGFIARTWQQRSALGTILDPVADKLLLMASFIALAYLRTIPIWLMVIIVSRDLMLIVGALLIHILTGRLEVMPSILGKLTTLFQFFSILLTLLLLSLKWDIPLLPLMFTLTAFLTILSGLHYISRELAQL